MKRIIHTLILLASIQFAVAQSFLERGVSSFNEGDYKQAITWFNWAAKADSTNPVCYSNRAHAKRSIKDFQGAFEDFGKVVELNPNDGNAYFWRALSAFNIGEFQTSLDANTKAIELGSEQGTQAYMNRAQTFMRLGKNQKALADYDSVIAAKDQRLMQAHFDRGQLYMRMNDQRSALKDFKKVVELNPENIQLTWDIGRVSYDLEEYADALSYYSRAIDRLETPQPQMLLIRGETFEKLKNYQAAIEDYTRVIKAETSLADAHYLRGQAKARLGDTDGACVDWKKAAELGHSEAKGVVVYNCK
ncbi:MAG: tetratricopeptide repeat protein [Flavobacteriales bacterium]|nr:tetratricopeptide repeat protein [Flavobacteriales bacterium]